MEQGHALARDQLQEIADASEGSFEKRGETIDSSGAYITFRITLPFQGIERVLGGIPVNAREQFLIRVHKTFPFETPVVYVPHRRFAGFSHVQGVKLLCLYQSLSDWKPEVGMYGLIERLDQWIRDAALDRLDPEEAPLHPPVAYTTSNRLVIPVADAPMPDDQPWFGYAALRERGQRTEIVGWQPTTARRPESFAAAILVHERLPFEFPRTVLGLTDELKRHGIDYGPLIWLLATAALHTASSTPMLVVLGTPMRRVDPGGPLLPHLEVWEVAADAADELRKLNAFFHSISGLEEMGRKAVEKVVQWSLHAEVAWCDVREARAAVTYRRDEQASTSWFRDKNVEIWGCGAIGTHVAESIARAGAKRIVLYDNGRVMPGVLVRQCFDDDDIGLSKVEALAKRLARINPNITIARNYKNLINALDEERSADEIDLVLDCTGSANLRCKLERALRDWPSPPPIASLGVNHNAEAALVTLSLPEHSGGPLDLVRRLKLKACRTPELKELLETFWPEQPRTKRFQPEPGCSEPTFVGSDADISALSARMLNAVASALQDATATGHGWLLHTTGPLHGFAFAPDTVIATDKSGLEVRVSSAALKGMCGWAHTSLRRHGPKSETGGLAFGELNQAAGVLWVSEVEGPPPDSDASEHHFTCGVAGMQEANESKRSRFRHSVACVGSWHTHPDSPAVPSDIDFGAVAQILGMPTATRRTCLLLILSGYPDDVTLGAHVLKARRRDDDSLVVDCLCSAVNSISPPTHPARNIGLALSGGGARAVAFHLGCFRALYDLRLLDRLEVVSSVSGGSVLAAMYAYSSDSFEDFDARVVDRLRTGFVRDVIRCSVHPVAIGKTIATVLVTGSTSLLRMAAKILPKAFRARVSLLNDAKPTPTRRFYSRTEAFCDALVSGLFGGRIVADVERKNLEVVINATELRTGSAFRFGSQESACWRFGTVPQSDVLVADAVAASAAYPVFLPALDRTYTFARRGTTKEDRVLLTDGGVFENLGVSPLEPGRDPLISSNVFNPEYIICCDAGVGLLDDDIFPLWWPSRMKRAFLTTFRKVQDATRKRLHQLDSANRISGFILSYLGQRDEALPWLPVDLPHRGEVYEYPTDFCAMDDEEIDRLALRGELLTRVLISYYHPDI